MTVDSGSARPPARTPRSSAAPRHRQEPQHTRHKAGAGQGRCRPGVAPHTNTVATPVSLAGALPHVHTIAAWGVPDDKTGTTQQGTARHCTTCHSTTHHRTTHRKHTTNCSLPSTTTC
ncbi:hypothetical protein E2C01_085815 [Portunus trituberculatus]|uniref:Uncharacterized protein n=1 Tax=Portunus trituberculatus TaxID=210409 RepID=A0A5B7J8K5_PORTR|nr:hypothetical protein [Portunus trituberculatus]